MPSDDKRCSLGAVFLSHIHVNNGFFFLLGINTLFFIFKTCFQDFHMNYVLVPEVKAANIVVVV